MLWSPECAFVSSILDSNGNELWNSGTQNLAVVEEGTLWLVLGRTGMPAIPASLTLKANLHLHITGRWARALA